MNPSPHRTATQCGFEHFEHLGGAAVGELYLGLRCLCESALNVPTLPNCNDGSIAHGAQGTRPSLRRLFRLGTVATVRSFATLRTEALALSTLRGRSPQEAWHAWSPRGAEASYSGSHLY
jgi:hypothetical protein